jgi:hypothetical protein
MFLNFNTEKERFNNIFNYAYSYRYDMHMLNCNGSLVMDIKGNAKYIFHFNASFVPIMKLKSKYTYYITHMFLF